MKDNDNRSAEKPSSPADLDRLTDELDRYIPIFDGVIDRAREAKLRIRSITRRREEAMSAGLWNADSAETSKMAKEESEMLRETEEAERRAQEFRDLCEKQSGRRIQLPPGHRLIQISSHILSATSYKRYVYPHIADMHSEYFPALQSGDLRKARMIELVFYFRVLWPIIRAVFLSVKTLFEFANK